MLLAKSCKKAYHVRNGVLRLGTLYQYRTIENEELIDKEEGMLAFHLNFHGEIEVPLNWYMTINPHIVFGDADPFIKPIAFPGRQSAKMVKHRIVSHTPRTVTIADTEAVFRREALNSFIFCMSLVRKTQDCIGIFKGCDDYWYLREAQAFEFGKRLAGMLGEYIHSSHAEGNYILPSDTDLESLQIHMYHGQVEYVSREIDAYEGQPLPLKDLAAKIQDMAFIKPDEYKSELEYRFHLFAVSKGQVVEPIVKYVDLNAGPIMNLIFD